MSSSSDMAVGYLPGLIDGCSSSSWGKRPRAVKRLMPYGESLSEMKKSARREDQNAECCRTLLEQTLAFGTINHRSRNVQSRRSSDILSTCPRVMTSSDLPNSEDMFVMCDHVSRKAFVK